MKKIDVHAHIPKTEDRSMETYLKIMDKYEVAAALVHAMPIEGRDNDQVLKVMRAHPTRFFGSIYIDLRDPVKQSIDTMTRYADEGFKCIKMFPNIGFDPNDEHLEPFWQAAEDRKLMCLSHCGFLTTTAFQPKDRISSLTATPFHFEVPVRRHKGINFIFAHFGGGASYLETIVMISRYENAYADTTPGWGRWVFAHNMPGLSDIDFSKILYGTDTCGEKYGNSEAWWIEKLSSTGRTQADIANHFYKNAERLLHLDEPRP